MWDSMTIVDWSQVRFAYIWVLLLLLGLPFLYRWLIKSGATVPSLRLSSMTESVATRNWKTSLVKILPILRMLALAMLVIAMARPQEQNSQNYSDSEGYDIMLCLDVSWSMESKDFKPNRLAVAKELTEDFVEDRPGDKIGLIVFSTQAVLRVPLTTDHRAVIDELRKANTSLEYSATAIGDAIGLGVDRMRNIDAVSKILVLITDGEETSGYMTAETALEVARAFEVKIYTIGIGSRAEALLPLPQADGSLREQKVEVNMDEELLQNLASETGGKFFRAADKTALQNIYAEIDKLEKSNIKIRENSQKKDVFMIFVFLAIIFIFIEWVLRYLILKPKP